MLYIDMKKCKPIVYYSDGGDYYYMDYYYYYYYNWYYEEDFPNVVAVIVGAGAETQKTGLIWIFYKNPNSGGSTDIYRKSSTKKTALTWTADLSGWCSVS